MPLMLTAVGVNDMRSLDAESTTEPTLTMLPVGCRFSQEAAWTVPVWMWLTVFWTSQFLQQIAICVRVRPAALLHAFEHKAVVAAV